MADLKRGGFAALALGATALTTLSLGGAAKGFTLPRFGHGAAPVEAPAAERHFTFPWAAHVDARTGNYAAKQFVEKRLTAGLPMDEAVARVRAAHASCHDDQRHGGGAVVCRYMIGSAGDMASLGEEIWTVTLTPGPDGKLAAAALDRSRAGIPGEAGDRAVFHWQVGDQASDSEGAQ
jgi:hypothetical protein